jgi:protein-S-isoprenylcysteine O-methyltransferase Ste14
MQLERSLRDPWVWGQFALIAAVLAASGPLARTLPGRLGPWSAIAGYLLLALGFAVMLRGAADLGRNLTPTTEPVPESRLVERGIYGLVRHPMYLGLCLLFAAVGLVARNGLVALLAFAAGVAYFEGKARTEERKLVLRHPRYREYAARVPRILPGGWK